MVKYILEKNMKWSHFLMKTRILSGIMMLPLFAIFLTNGIPLYIGILLLSVLSVYEFDNALKVKNIHSYSAFAYLISIVLFIKNMIVIDTTILKSIYIAFFTIIMLYTLLKSKKISHLLINIFGYSYILFGFNAIVMISKYSIELMWLIFVITLVSDTMAYFIGNFFGKNKLAPKISPNKTIEGSIGAILFCILSCIVFGVSFNLNISLMTLIGIIGCMISQIGDLVASLFKRYVGIKDYGKLIPGHGGILDRFDSAILVSQFIYMLTLILYKI